MDLLAGIDDIPWSELDNCYGRSDAIPGLLRTIASSAPGAEDAFQELCQLVIHQGSVYPVTALVVPFLARIAAAGISPADILGLMAVSAENDVEDGCQVARYGEPGAVRAAIAASVNVLAPLLGNDDGEVRRVAAWALTQCGVPDELVGHLRLQWDVETDQTVKVTLLKAISLLDPALAGRLAETIDSDSADGGTLLAAALAKVAAGVPWTERLRDTAIIWVSDSALPRRYEWNSNHDPFDDVVLSLAARGEVEAAVDLVAHALVVPAAEFEKRDRWDVSTRQRALWAAEHLAQRYRHAAPGLLDPLAVVAGGADAEAALSALSLLKELWNVAPVADRLAVLADAVGPDRRADEALALLIAIDDARASALLVRELLHRPAALAAAAGREPALPFSLALLNAVRALLRDDDTQSQGLMALSLLRAWGNTAALAAPDVLALPPEDSMAVAETLVAIGAEVPARIVDTVRQLATAGRKDWRLGPARQLHELSGETGPLLDAIEHGLNQRSRMCEFAAKAASRISFGSDRLVPLIQAAMRESAGSPMTQPSTTAALALALWRHCADASAVLPVLAGMLQESADERVHWFQVHAVQAAGEIGADAEPLAPLILPLLESEWTCAEAVLALLKIRPDLDVIASTADRLVDALATARHNDAPIEALRAIRTQLPHQVAERLHALAGQEADILPDSDDVNHNRREHEIRTAIHSLLGE